MIDINFNAEQAVQDTIKVMENMRDTAGIKGVVLGISGGKDCAAVAGLAARVFGPEHVIGIMAPNSSEKDIEYAHEIINYTGIKSAKSHIEENYNAILARRLEILSQLGVVELYDDGGYWEDRAKTAAMNIAPRVRMQIFYDIAGCFGYRVIGTSNLSERVTGYTTKWGDMVSDFNPIANYTCTEVILMCKALGFSERIWAKPPEDGLTGRIDEENLKVTYDNIHRTIRGLPCDEKARMRVHELYQKSGWHKIKGVITIPNDLYCAFDF
jgi:NAD+ synthase